MYVFFWQEYINSVCVSDTYYVSEIHFHNSALKITLQTPSSLRVISLVIIRLIICRGNPRSGSKALPTTARIGGASRRKSIHTAQAACQRRQCLLRVCMCVRPQRSFPHLRKCHRVDRFSRTAAGDERCIRGGCGARDRHPQVDDVSRRLSRFSPREKQIVPNDCCVSVKIDSSTGKDAR